MISSQRIWLSTGSYLANPRATRFCLRHRGLLGQVELNLQVDQLVNSMILMKGTILLTNKCFGPGGTRIGTHKSERWPSSCNTRKPASRSVHTACPI